jgi:pimeloyl-ACP methyl ester carboxylesterase
VAALRERLVAGSAAWRQRSWLHWVRNIEALSRRHMLWLPDMPCYGDSDSIDGDLRSLDAMDRLVDTFVDSMRALNELGAPIDLAGFSFGGFVAARVASRGGERRLALLGPAGHGGRRERPLDLVEWRSLTAIHSALRCVKTSLR